MAEGTGKALGEAWSLFWRGLGERIAPRPVRDERALAEFLGSRAAQVAQASLFGYLKTRMGTQHRELFQDPAMADAIAAAQETIFHACLCDLTIHAVGMVAGGRALTEGMERQAAQALYLAGTVAAGARAPTAAETGLVAERAGAEQRDEDAFAHSIATLVEIAPVSHEHMERDGGIVAASMRYRWIEIRRQVRARLDQDALADRFRVAGNLMLSAPG